MIDCSSPGKTHPVFQAVADGAGHDYWFLIDDPGRVEICVPVASAAPPPFALRPEKPLKGGS